MLKNRIEDVLSSLIPRLGILKFLSYKNNTYYELSNKNHNHYEKFISRNVGYDIKLNATKSIEDLGLTYIPLEKTIEDMVTQMQESKIV